MESDNNFYLYKTDTKNQIYRGSTTARFSDDQFTIGDVAEITNVQDLAKDNMSWTYAGVPYDRPYNENFDAKITFPWNQQTLTQIKAVRTDADQNFTYFNIWRSGEFLYADFSPIFPNYPDGQIDLT